VYTYTYIQICKFIYIARVFDAYEQPYGRTGYVRRMKKYERKSHSHVQIPICKTAHGQSYGRTGYVRCMKEYERESHIRFFMSDV